MDKYKLQVKIELTKRCGLNCVHCSSNASVKSNREINSKHIDNILDNSTFIGQIVLTGGEPFYCSHFFETLLKINNVGLLPVIYTSGIYDTSKCKIALKSLYRKISKLVVSLHGPAFIHDQITKQNGSFNLTVEFLKDALYHHIPIGIHIIALRSNIKMIQNLIDWLLEQGFSDFSILRYVPQGRGFYRNIEPPTKEMLHELYQILLKHNVRFGAPFNFIHNKSIACKVGYRTVMIDVFGNVLPCDSFKDIGTNYNMNNLSSHSLLDIFNNLALFNYVRDNNMMLCDYECCLGQFLLEKQKENYLLESLESYA